MKSLAEKYEVKEIEINKLRIDVDNARWEGTAKDEEDAIKRLIKKVGKPKMQNLINNFAEDQIQYLPLLVIEIDNEYIVKDGNRRLYALKFLAGLLKNIDLMAMNNSIKKTTKVLIHNYYNSEDLLNAINIIHGVGNKGTGLEPFGSIEKERTNTKRVTRRLALLILDVINNSLKEEEKIKADDIGNFTNFERMINSKPVKDYFGIKKKGKTIEFDYTKTNEIVKLIVESKNIKVSEIYTSSEATQKVKTILEKEKLPVNANSKTKIVAQFPKERQPKIKNYILKSSLKKIISIDGFNKFAKALTNIQYPHNLEIAGPLYRVLLDYSIRYYCDINEIETTEFNQKKQKTIDKNLFSILPKALKFMKEKDKLEKTLADRVLMELNKPNSNYISLLNKSTHNYNFFLTEADFRDIKKIFDPIILFIIGI